MRKTKRKRRPSSEQKQTKEQVPRGFKETHVLAVINKGQNERKKTYSHKTKPNRGEGAAAKFQKCKEAFVSYNEKSDDEE